MGKLGVGNHNSLVLLRDFGDFVGQFSRMVWENYREAILTWEVTPREGEEWVGVIIRVPNLRENHMEIATYPTWRLTELPLTTPEKEASIVLSFIAKQVTRV